MPGRTDLHPLPLDSDLTVNDLSAVGNELWAVGQDRFPGPALIAHTAGGQPWQLISYSSSSEVHHTTLRGVHATTSGDVWAVGSVGLPERTHIIHGDGTTWQQVESPDGADGESLADVAASGRDDAFAVGSRHPSPPSPLADLAEWDTLAVRWDGARWATVPGPGQGLLSGVCAVGPGAYWAVGTTRIATRAGNFALVAHYADEHWQAGSEVPGSLSDVAATGPDDVWAVGRDQDPSHPPGPLILHYDGHTWAPADAPVVDGNAWLEAVACAGRDNVWAVGGKERDDGFSGPFILHFDGSAWVAVEPPPGFAASTGKLKAVTVLPGEAVWAAGRASPLGVATGFTLPLS